MEKRSAGTPNGRRRWTWIVLPAALVLGVFAFLGVRGAGSDRASGLTPADSRFALDANPAASQYCPHGTGSKRGRGCGGGHGHGHGHGHGGNVNGSGHGGTGGGTGGGGGAGGGAGGETSPTGPGPCVFTFDTATNAWSHTGTCDIGIPVDATGHWALLVDCAGNATCKGTLESTTQITEIVNGKPKLVTVKIDPRKYKVTPQRTKTIKMRLNKKGRALIAKDGGTLDGKLIAQQKLKPSQTQLPPAKTDARFHTV